MERIYDNVLDRLIEVYGPEFVGGMFKSNPEIMLLTVEELLQKVKSSRRGQTDIHGQTELFRDIVVLQTFENVVLANYSPDQAIHVASIGCSHGKEPYSLLLKNWNQKERLKIDAFDVNPKRIETAIIGEYDGLEKRELTCLEKLDWVNPNEAYSLTYGIGGVEGIKFSEEMKRGINFQVHDILKEPLPQKYDVVLSLNVLMHYYSKERRKILSNIYRSMNGGGWLLCEATNSDDPFPERREYFKWMENLETLGFETIIQPPHTISLESRTAKTYRKRESLMVQFA